MNDLETAKAGLEGHSICLCKDGECIADDGRGISPMMKLIAAGTDLRGYSAADVIVGKAAAMLFVKAGITAVYGKTMSESGRAYLEQSGIPCVYDVLTERIINRQGSDICPMEKTVAALSDADAGYQALCETMARLRNHAGNG